MATTSDGRDLSQLSLQELFLEADRIGNKYQNPKEQEIAAQRLERAIALLQISEEPTYIPRAKINEQA